MIGRLIFKCIVSNTILQKTPPDHLRGRVMSLRVLAFAGMAPIGSMYIGVAGEWLGPQKAVALGGIVCLLVVIFVIFKIPDLVKSE